MAASCSSNGFLYNVSLCACNPGYYLSPNRSCNLLSVAPGGDWIVHQGVESSPTFLTTILSFDSIRRFTKSQAIFLEATLVLLLLWLSWCIILRFRRRSKDGNNALFRIRWWISRFDFFYSRSHWSDDNKAVVRRRTELGGTLSVASFILFIGLLSALLYQVIDNRTLEIHKIRPANAPDLIPFVNDMEFNITTISSMSCSHLRGLDTLVSGTPGLNYKTVRLSTYANYSCHNTSKGPVISLKCNRCQVPRDNYFISWQFVDLPNDPAVAAGFEFNLTAKSHGDDKRLSFVSGIVNSGGRSDCRPKTFRGRDTNIFKVHLFPQVYFNLHNLRIIQPLLHEFVPGSSFLDVSELQSSLQGSVDGLINTTVSVRFLSDYVVEINKRSILGAVSFLANVGGLYAISTAIFLFVLFQCERRIKSLRNEDADMRAIRNRRRARLNWDKVRKYVMYTWGPSNLDRDNAWDKKARVKSRFLHRPRQPVRMDSILSNEMSIPPRERTIIIPEKSISDGVAESASGATDDLHSPHD